MSMQTAMPSRMLAIATTATSAKYGAVEGGKLVNKGEKVYTDESWTNYVNALVCRCRCCDHR